jgi:hypothetical protein
MELILNVAWLVIAVGSYLFLIRRLASHAPRGARFPSRSQQIVALTCILAILFPVISLSDDLLALRASVEDASLSRLAVKKIGPRHGSTRSQTLHDGFLVASSLATGVRWIALRRIAIGQNFHILLCLQPSTVTRAPPSGALTLIS